MRQNKKNTYVLLYCCMSLLATRAQNYHAIQGSSMAGSLGVHNNPASIVNTPFRWDVTLAGVQAKGSTNLVNVWNYSILSPPSQSEYFFGGTGERFGITSANLNLINTRVALSRRKAIAFGVNVRNYVNIRTSDYYYNDTIKTVSEIFARNEGNQPVSANLVNNGWIELYGTYAQTIFDNEFGRLNVGLTVKLNRGISGAHASLSNGRYSSIPGSNPANFTITDAILNYGYSSNYDRWQSELSSKENLGNFVRYTEGGGSIDFGAEWIVKSQAAPIFGEDDYFDYDWKLGISLLDIGVNQFKYGLQSRKTSGVMPNVTSETLVEKFDSTISSFSVFNDSLATIAEGYGHLNGIFRVINPARMVLNADRYLVDNFYINAELSINLAAMFGKKYFYVKEMNIVTVTPRWETKNLGAYMPLTLNSEKQFWVGAAFKAGPLLLGLHNLGYIFSKKSITKGGGYVAIIIRAPGSTGKKRDRTLDCPDF